MLANDNWMGALPLPLRPLRWIEMVMLLPMRVVRSRTFCHYGNKVRELRMPASLGTAMIVPCADAGQYAAKWPAGGVKSPLSADYAATHLADKYRIVLSGPIDVPQSGKDWSHTQLLRWLEKELKGCPDLCVRKDIMRDAAQFIQEHSLWQGTSLIDVEQLKSLPEDGVPSAFLLPLCSFESEARVADELRKAVGKGPADARQAEEGQTCPQEQAVEQGIAAMPIVPASHLEQLDPSRPMMNKMAELEKHIKDDDEASDASDEDLEGTDLLRDLGKEALKLEQIVAEHKEGLEDGSEIDKLANMFEPFTWHAALFPLFCWGDGLPYLRRRGGEDVQLTMRESLAYLLEREELYYPDSGDLVEPSGWRGAEGFSTASW
eukprot:gene8746-3567_t